MVMVRDRLQQLIWATGRYDAQYGYMPSALGGKSPVLAMDYAGSRYTPGGNRHHQVTTYRFVVWTFIRRKNADLDVVETTLSDIESDMQQMILDNRSMNGYWLALEAGQSVGDYLEIRGVGYRSLAIELEVQINTG